MAAMAALQVMAADGAGPYPKMAAFEQYAIARADEIALARSAAPPSIADHAEVLVMGPHGYETAVKGTNGFVCYVSRSWDVAFDDPEFWNPKVRSPQCMNPAAFRSVLPRYLERTEWVLAGVPKTEIQARETAARTAGKLKAPEPGAMCFMMSRGSYINDIAAGPWHPHIMFFVPHADGSQFGASMPGSPIHADSASYADTTIVMVVVSTWSDGTPGHQK